jgi:hypothetical protein
LDELCKLLPGIVCSIGSVIVVFDQLADKGVPILEHVIVLGFILIPLIR